MIRVTAALWVVKISPCLSVHHKKKEAEEIKSCFVIYFQAYVSYPSSPPRKKLVAIFLLGVCVIDRELVSHSRPMPRKSWRVSIIPCLMIKTLSCILPPRVCASEWKGEDSLTGSGHLTYQVYSYPTNLPASGVLRWVVSARCQVCVCVFYPPDSHMHLISSFSQH